MAQVSFLCSEEKPPPFEFKSWYFKEYYVGNGTLKARTCALMRNADLYAIKPKRRNYSQKN